MVAEESGGGITEMGIASGMRDLTQDIASTREDRMNGVAGMKEGTQDSIKALRGSRRKAALEFGDELARNRAGRKREVKMVVGGARSTIKSLHISGGKSLVRCIRNWPVGWLN